MNDEPVWFTVLMFGLIFVFVIGACCLDGKHRERVEALAKKHGGNVVQYAVDQNNVDYFIALPNGKVWFHPETTDPPGE